MSKKKDFQEKQKKKFPSGPFLDLQGVSKRGWKVIGTGVGIVLLGFFVLSLTDPEGRNWASNLSPFLILGGYGVIAWGIVLPDSPTDEKNPEEPAA